MKDYYIEGSVFKILKQFLDRTPPGLVNAITAEIKAEKDISFKEGVEEGEKNTSEYAKAFEEGKKEGYAEGFSEGMRIGWSEAMDQLAD